jgi:succinyldiaminopimelate transaminase
MANINEFNSWLISLNPFALTKNEEVKSRLEAQNIEVYDFTLGDPKEATPYFIKEALIKGIDDVSQYPMNIGSPLFRKTCANWAKRRLSIELNPEAHIISSNGSKEAVFHIPQVLFHSGSSKRIVIFPEPGYPVYKAGTVLAGGIPYAIPLSKNKGYVFDPSDIPDEIAKHVSAVWLCYPHNPTGAIISRNEMNKIYDWALKFEIMILSDECYLDMFYEGQSIPISFLEISQKNNFNNVLCFFSLSKRSGMTGYRSGFVAGQKEVISLFAKYRLNVGLGTPDFVQKAAIAAWDDNSHVIERSRIFSNKRKVVDQFFAKNKINALPSNATFYVWGDIPNNYSSDREFVDKLLEATGIMVTTGSSFGESCSRNFRMALVPTVEKIEECLKKWQLKIDSGNFRL